MLFPRNSVRGLNPNRFFRQLDGFQFQLIVSWNGDSMAEEKGTNLTRCGCCCCGDCVGAAVAFVDKPKYNPTYKHRSALITRFLSEMLVSDSGLNRLSVRGIENRMMTQQSFYRENDYHNGGIRCLLWPYQISITHHPIASLHTCIDCCHGRNLLFCSSSVAFQIWFFKQRRWDTRPTPNPPDGWRNPIDLLQPESKVNIFEAKCDEKSQRSWDTLGT